MTLKWHSKIQKFKGSSSERPFFIVWTGLNDMTTIDDIGLMDNKQKNGDVMMVWLNLGLTFCGVSHWPFWSDINLAESCRGTRHADLPWVMWPALVDGMCRGEFGLSSPPTVLIFPLLVLSCLPCILGFCSPLTRTWVLCTSWPAWPIQPTFIGHVKICTTHTQIINTVWRNHPILQHFFPASIVPSTHSSVSCFS